MLGIWLIRQANKHFAVLKVRPIAGSIPRSIGEWINGISLTLLCLVLEVQHRVVSEWFI